MHGKMLHSVLWYYSKTRTYNMQKSPWPVELNVTCHEMVKRNLTLKNVSRSSIFKRDLVFLCYEYELLYILFLALYWECRNSPQVWDKLKDLSQGHSWSSVGFHSPPLCRFNPTFDRSQGMCTVMNIRCHEMIKCNLTLKNTYKVTHLWRGCGPW